MTLPDGFRAALFAGEPDVVQPIAFTFDDRGRLWVVECLSYPKWTTARQGTDRVVIFEDTDGDGRFDKRTVFYDKGANLTGIAVGFGGVWLCSSPNLIFIPDRDGRDRPDGPPVVLLDGWDILKAQHNVFNGLTWGPDGWLYGCNGIQSNSRVGKPGAANAERVFLNCGVWRYHPTRQVFEVVAHGTTNPWGLDFDDYGEAFITNCVIKHLWHVVPGAHFQRMYGEDANPHTYGLLQSCADHIHWGGGHWTDSRSGKGVHDVAGGGHAHVGAMVYLGDNWPETYRHGLFTCNLHGNRVNHDTLERRGSGYVAHHATDFLLANDPWFRGLSIQYGPDGGVFISDWSDTGECHNHVEVDRSNGRIYKVTYGQPAWWRGDLARLSDSELVRLQLHHNDWHVRHARRILHERAATGKLKKATHAELRKMLREQSDVTRQLRALWALHVTGGADQEILAALLDNRSDYVRGWAIRLLLEHGEPADTTLAKLAKMAVQDPSSLVRLALASGLQRLPAARRWSVAEALIAHGEDSADAYLPLMNWYGIEPLVPLDRERSLHLIRLSKIPLVREYIARRLSPEPSSLNALVRQLGQSDERMRLDILHGIQEAFLGQRQVAMPDGWPATYRRLVASPNASVREQAMLLAVLFDYQDAMTALRRLVADRSAETTARLNALQALVYKKDAALIPLLQDLLTDRAIRAGALRSLAMYDDKASPRLILSQYPSFTDEEKADAISTLASRSSYALALLDAIEKGQVPRKDVSAFTVRQMQALRDRTVNERVTRVWGTVRPASADKRGLMARYKAQLTPMALKGADRSKGRLVFQHVCASCHILFGEGGKVGPELTGSQRMNLDYLLENILDPSALVPSEYQVSILELKDGRVITGIVKSEAGKVLTVQMEKDLVRVPASEVAERQKSPVSMMPEGLLGKLKEEEMRDLIAYLASPEQVPLPKGAERP
ncbi:MAG TPA: PVC-type heme-binding CxxCH protein [Gemmataceae bacterium]|jgi:putative membrane-bound dehydrogenase-like protein|nr:PVC-type heme-binding CxxCH protein [Gemmataceae bacterium]